MNAQMLLADESQSVLMWGGAIGAVLLLLLFVMVFIIKQYKRCPSNRVLVIYGKVGGSKASKCLHGGGTFVVPLIQDYAFLSLEPMVIEIPLERQCRALMTDARRGKKTNRFKGFVNRYLNYFAPGNVLDTILRSFNGAQMQVAEHSCQFADVVIRPLSFDGRWHDFRRPGKYIAIGRREAEEHVEEIKALINRKEPTHEISPAQHSMAAPA